MFCICDGDTIREDHKLFDDRLKSFGDSLLFIYNPKEFARRLINELQKKMSEDKDVSNFKAHKVEYINRSSYNGEMGSFRKFNNFAHQQEWRIAIQSVYNSEEPYKLVIGSIKDISMILPLKDVKNEVLVDGSKITLCL